MPAQDDAREQQMLNLFNLTLPPDRTRSGLDAILDLDDGSESVPFELKSTTTTSVATVRDFGPDHIVKWSRLHWLFAFYAKDAITLRHCYYASPADMADWINEKEAYIRPDLVLADRAPQLLTVRMQVGPAAVVLTQLLTGFGPSTGSVGRSAAGLVLHSPGVAV